LVPLIKTAAKSRDHTPSRSRVRNHRERCLRCHVNRRRWSGRLTRRLTTYNANKPQHIFNAIIEYHKARRDDGFGGYK